MKRSARIAIAIPLAAFLAAWLVPGARAQETIDETRQVKSDVSVEVENISGSVVVVGWDRDEVKITGTLGHGTERLDIDDSPGRVRIEVVLPRHARNVERDRPRDPHAGEGLARGQDRQRRRGGGGHRGRSLPGDRECGDIDLDARPAEADAQTVSGDIRLQVESNEVRAEAVSGDIVITKASGAVDAETVSGDIVVEGGIFSRLDAQTVSGGITLTGDFSKGGTYRFESHSGSIELWLPQTVSADFEVSTYSGEIDSDFGGHPRRTGKYTPGEELDLTTGDGGASVRIDTFSGDVELRTR